MVPVVSRLKKVEKSLKKWSKNGAQEGYPIGVGAPPDGVAQGSRAKKSKKKANATKRWLPSISIAVFEAKKWPT